MKWLQLLFPLALFAIMIASCDHVSYTPYGTSVDEEYEDTTAKNVARLLAASEGDDELRIALIGDPQRQFDTSKQFVAAINQRDDIDLVIVLGDLTNYGLRDEYETVVDIYSQLRVPWLTVVGNHDILGKGEYLYARVFGDQNHVVDYNDIRLVFFNSNGRHAEDAAPNFIWLRENTAVDERNFTQAVVFSHIPPTSRSIARTDAQRDEVQELFTKTLLSSGKVNLTLHGHLHVFEEQDLGTDEIFSLVVDTPDDANYVIATLTADDYEIERVFF